MAASGLAVALLRPAPSAAPPVAGPAAAPKTTTTLHWMGHWQGEDRRETLVLEMAREFAFLHPDVTVDLRFPAEIMGVRSQRRTAEFIVAQLALERPEWDWCGSTT
jgi:ABC-type glycerol-3-phosphate transport system substrate-binding protein